MKTVASTSTPHRSLVSQWVQFRGWGHWKMQEAHRVTNNPSPPQKRSSGLGIGGLCPLKGQAWGTCRKKKIKEEGRLVTLRTGSVNGADHC